MATQRESALSNKIKKWLESQGWKVWKNAGSQFQEAGRPDLMGLKLIVCFAGCEHSSLTKFLAIETKMPGKEPTALQQRYLDDLAEQGAIAFCAHSLDEVKQEMQRRGLA